MLSGSCATRWSLLEIACEHLSALISKQIEWWDGKPCQQRSEDCWYTLQIIRSDTSARRSRQRNSFAPRIQHSSKVDRNASLFGYTPPTDMIFEITKSILLIVTALFPIVNPIGGSPVFLLLTQDY